MSIEFDHAKRETPRTAFSVKGLRPDVADELARLARANGMSVAALIRETLTALTQAISQNTHLAELADLSEAPRAISSSRSTRSYAPRGGVTPTVIASRLHHAHAVVARRVAVTLALQSELPWKVNGSYRAPDLGGTGAASGMGGAGDVSQRGDGLGPTRRET